MSTYQSFSAMYAQDRYQPPYVAVHRRRRDYRWAIAAALFVASMAFLAAGIIAMGEAGIDVVAVAPWLAMIAFGGAAFASMIIVVNRIG